MTHTYAAHDNMMRYQLQACGIQSPSVFKAFRRVSRTFFVPEVYQSFAYADFQIPLMHDQCMLSPMQEATMLEALALTPESTVLEVGTGSGYFTALLAACSKHVLSLDIFSDFIEAATAKWQSCRITNIQPLVANAASGFATEHLFDAMVLTGSLPVLPNFFKEGLAIDGRLLAVIGSFPLMRMLRITRVGEHTWEEETLGETYLPPLIRAKLPNK